MGIPSGEARQCTPAGTEAVILALAPTAPQPIKEMPHGVTPQQMRTPQGLHPGANAPYWPCPDTLAQTRQVGALELRMPRGKCMAHQLRLQLVRKNSPRPDQNRASGHQSQC